MLKENQEILSYDIKKAVIQKIQISFYDQIKGQYKPNYKI